MLHDLLVLLLSNFLSSDHVQDHFLDGLHPERVLLVVLQDVELHALDFLVDVEEFLALRNLFVHLESCNDVPDTADFLEGVLSKVEVVEHEPQVVFLAQGHLLLPSLGVGVAHNCN